MSCRLVWKVNRRFEVLNLLLNEPERKPIEMLSYLRGCYMSGHMRFAFMGLYDYKTQR